MNKYLESLPIEPGCFRATFSLPADLAKAINFTARRLNCSQSALVTVLLTPQIAHLYGADFPEPGPDSPQRATGSQIDELRSRIQSALDGLAFQ